MSQNQHLRLQPLVRMKKLGVPVSFPSPWRLENISAIRSVFRDSSTASLQGFPLLGTCDSCENPAEGLVADNRGKFIRE